MRRLLGVILLISVLAPVVGCIIPAYSGDPRVRTEELIFTSENFRAILQEWRRIWFLDQPDHMTPQRVHGGVI